MDVEDIFADQLKTVIVFLIVAAFYIGPLILLYVTFWLVSLPLRRRERARLFLDLLELGLNDGHTAERAIVEAAGSKDAMLGWQYRFLAEFLKGGMPLAKALPMVPRLVPPQIAAMLKVGAEIGDVQRVLPACRQMLNDALSQTRGALNYLAILTFVVLPVVPIVSLIMITFVMPKFEMIARDMGQGLPVLSQLTFGFSRQFVLLQIVVMLGFQFLMLCYIAGPRMKGWLSWLSFLVDRLHWSLPWRRKRIQRDFATMLALLLDSGVPEQRAVMLAAESANNSIFTRRAHRAADQISAGTKLTEAVRGLDSSGEFHWRIANATHGPQGFIAALRGWFEALDAKAFQQEQAAAQTLTTALVVWNGFVIGVFVVGMFNVLTNLVQEASLW